MNGKKIVISDIGTISPLGTSLKEVEASLLTPPAYSEVREFEFHSCDTPVKCSMISDFDPVSILGKKGLRTKDKVTKMLLCATELGFKQIMESSSEAKRPGLCVGTAFGSIQSIGDFLSDSIINGVNTVNPQAFANTVINAPTGNTNIRYLARNLSSTIATGFNSGLDSFVYSVDFLQRGYMKQLVVGGLEEISYYALLGFDRSGLLSPSGIIRPFAVDSDGVVLGEGCSLFMLEPEESAKERNATIFAEITGSANGFDPSCGREQRTDGTVYASVIRNACNQAGISPSDIDFIASGASGNRLSDDFESKGIEKACGPDVPVTAYKKFTGECYGASGALNVLCTIADMRNNRISGICDEPYETTGSVNVVFGSIERQIAHVLVSSCSCDGNCSALILKNVN